MEDQFRSKNRYSVGPTNLPTNSFNNSFSNQSNNQSMMPQQKQGISQFNVNQPINRTQINPMQMNQPSGLSSMQKDNNAFTPNYTPMSMQQRALAPSPQMQQQIMGPQTNSESILFDGDRSYKNLMTGQGTTNDDYWTGGKVGRGHQIQTMMGNLNGFNRPMFG